MSAVNRSASMRSGSAISISVSKASASCGWPLVTRSRARLMRVSDTRTIGKASARAGSPCGAVTGSSTSHERAASATTATRPITITDAPIVTIQLPPGVAVCGCSRRGPRDRFGATS